MRDRSGWGRFLRDPRPDAVTVVTGRDYFRTMYSANADAGSRRMAKSPKNEIDRTQGRRRGPKKATAQSLRNAALYYLQRYASSAENLRRVLMRRVERASRTHETDVAACAEIVSEIIARYRETGLLDDEAYATAQAQSLHRRGTSLGAIRARLYGKGVGARDY